MLEGGKQIVASLPSKFAEELTPDLAASAQTIADHDAQLLRQIAHRIKGTSANLHAARHEAGHVLHGRRSNCHQPFNTEEHILLDRAPTDTIIVLPGDHRVSNYLHVL